MVKVFIIILNWNRKRDTIDCIHSLTKMRYTGIDAEIIVVDNASSDGSVKTFRDIKSTKPKVKIIDNKSNLGFAGGNNVGLRYALKSGADYVLLINNDTYVEDDLLVNMVKAANSQKRVGAVSPKIYFAKGYEFHHERYKKGELGKVIWSAGGSMDWDNVFGSNRGVDEVDTGQYETQEEIDFATGACVLYSAKALRDVGVFNDIYFMYFEDTDLSQRFLRNNWNILYEPKAVLWHKVAQSSSIGSDLNDYFITRNRLLFGLAHAPIRSKIALLRQNMGFLYKGRKWQKMGVRDYFICKFYKGSWK